MHAPAHLVKDRYQFSGTAGPPRFFCLSFIMWDKSLLASMNKKGAPGITAAETHGMRSNDLTQDVSELLTSEMEEQNSEQL